MFCPCENPLMDVAHDAGCRRCGNPVDFTPRLGRKRLVSVRSHDVRTGKPGPWRLEYRAVPA